MAAASVGWLPWQHRRRSAGCQQTDDAACRSRDQQLQPPSHMPHMRAKSAAAFRMCRSHERANRRRSRTTTAYARAETAVAFRMCRSHEKAAMRLPCSRLPWQHRGRNATAMQRLPLPRAVTAPRPQCDCHAATAMALRRSAGSDVDPLAAAAVSLLTATPAARRRLSRTRQ